MTVYHELMERRRTRRLSSMPPRRERRRGVDIWTQAPVLLGAVAWTSALTAVMFADKARPRAFASDVLFGVHRATGTDLAMVRTAAMLLALSFVLCVVGLAVNSLRLRRKADRYRRSLIVLAVLCTTALSSYFLVA